MRLIDLMMIIDYVFANIYAEITIIFAVRKMRWRWWWCRRWAPITLMRPREMPMRYWEISSWWWLMIISDDDIDYRQNIFDMMKHYYWWPPMMQTFRWGKYADYASDDEISRRCISNEIFSQLHYRFDGFRQPPPRGRRRRWHFQNI